MEREEKEMGGEEGGREGERRECYGKERGQEEREVSILLTMLIASRGSLSYISIPMYMYFTFPSVTNTHSHNFTCL